MESSSTVTDLGYQALEIILPLLMLVLTYASARFAAWLRRRIENEKIEEIFLRVNDAVLTAVRELQQILVDELKRANADGKIAPHEKDAIREKALENVKSYLGARGIKILMRVLGLTASGAERYLGAQVERAVFEERERARRQR
jgi:hypothetical protein